METSWQGFIKAIDSLVALQLLAVILGNDFVQLEEQYAIWIVARNLLLDKEPFANVSLEMVVAVAPVEISEVAGPGNLALFFAIEVIPVQASPYFESI